MSPAVKRAFDRSQLLQTTSNSSGAVGVTFNATVTELQAEVKSPLLGHPDSPVAFAFTVKDQRCPDGPSKTRDRCYLADDFADNWPHPVPKSEQVPSHTNTNCRRVSRLDEFLSELRREKKTTCQRTAWSAGFKWTNTSNREGGRSCSQSSTICGTPLRQGRSLPFPRSSAGCRVGRLPSRTRPWLAESPPERAGLAPIEQRVRVIRNRRS